MAAAMPRKLLVTQYDPAWPMTFDQLRFGIMTALGDVAVSIEHVGSTAVPGLAAKPVIDIDAVIRSPAELPVAIDRLAHLGYVHEGDLGIVGREAFLSPANLPEHHLYVCLEGGSALLNHLAVRDRLRRDPVAAAAYARLKLQLAERFPFDIDRYVAGKSEFLAGILRAGVAPLDA